MSLLSYLKVTQCSTSEIGDAPLYNSCSLPIQGYNNRTIASTVKMQIWIATINRNVPSVMKTKFPAAVMVFGFTSCHLTSSKSAWKSTPKCTWMCWRVWWSPGANRWPVADPGCGSKTRRRSTSPKRPRLSFRRSATTLYPFLIGHLLPRPEPAGLLSLVIRREHHQHDLPQHQSQPDRRHPPGIHRAPAGAGGKVMLPVPDPYRGGDWGWRRLHWIHVSSTS